ncbi:MAG: LysE family translocator [Alphaproteobacteria bacterium]|nr:LysE family translocator [Alphaproteobacteria bacterium]
MNVEMLAALTGFAFVMSISPGPGNFLLLASGANFGFRRSLPLLLGISSGFLTILFCVGLGLGALLQRHPELHFFLRLGCGLYVLWLALRIARSRSAGAAADPGAARPITFLEAALLQIVNPKAWAVSLIVTVSYTRPEQFMASLLLLIAVFAMVNLPSLGVWVVSGSALRGMLAKGRRIAVFNVAMALLLVASMAPALLASG